MSWLWIYWPSALLFLAFVMFAIPEYLAIHYSGPTFSRFMATVRKSDFGPLWCFAWGGLCVGLAVHFSTWCMYDVH